MKAKEWFWSFISLLISFLVIVTWHFHIWNFSFFGHCHVTSPYMELLSFFGRFVQKVIVSCFFQIHFVNFYGSIQMAATMLQSIPRFFTKFSEKSLFFSAKTYEKYIVWTDYCIVHHNNKSCFLPGCKYRIILFGNVEELLKKLNTFASLINTWTACIRHSSIVSVEKLLQRVDKCLITCSKQLILIKETREWIECRALRKRDVQGKSTRSIFSAPFKIRKRRKLVDQCLQKELNKFKRLNSS